MHLHEREARRARSACRSRSRSRRGWSPAAGGRRTRGQQRPAREHRGRVRRQPGGARADRVEHAGRPRQAEAGEVQERRGARLVEVGERRSASAAVGARRPSRRRAPSMKHEAGEVARAGAAAEVPRRVGGRDRRRRASARRAPRGRPPRLRGGDHAVQVADRDGHAPALGVGDVGVGHRARSAAGVRACRSSRGSSRRPLHGGLALERAVAARSGPRGRSRGGRSTRPASPAGGARRSRGDREEVRRAGRGPGLEHEHVPRRRRAHLQDPDAVQPRGPGRARALQGEHVLARGGGRRAGGERRGGDERGGGGARGGESGHRRASVPRAAAQATTLSRPARLAAYRRWSARRPSSSSALASGAETTPMLAVTPIPGASAFQGSSRIAARRRSQTAAAGRRRCRASAPRTPRRRCARRCPRRASRSSSSAATRTSTSSPAWWPKRSLIDLKWSRSRTAS